MSIASINEGKYCRTTARLSRENADRDLRFALAGLAVAVIAGGAGLVLNKNNEGAKPQYSDERVPSTQDDRHDPSDADLPNQLRQLSDLHESGGLSDAEFQEAKRKLLE
ncbi:MAG: SHOCT domain-containing protein [Actinomycetota bacterium]|nr:SHOCT domain-containing protein [Actinomycetota bacterium]